MRLDDADFADFGTPREIPKWVLDRLALDDGTVRRRNHWVPVTYLRHFTADGQRNGPMWLYDREDPGNPREVTPLAVAAENDLYTAEGYGLPAPDLMERVYSMVEGRWTGLRNRLLHGTEHGFYPWLGPSTEMTLATFVGMLMTRTPAFRDQVEWSASVYHTAEARFQLEARERIKERHRARTGEELSDERIAEMAEEIESGLVNWRLNEGQWIGLAGSLSMTAAEVIADLRKAVLHHPSIGLPASDNPVCPAVRPRGQRTEQLGAGLKESEAEVTLPLDPGAVLLMTPDTRDDIGEEWWWEDVLERTVANSQRFVFARQQDPKIPEILEATSPPVPVLEVGDEQFHVGTDVGLVIKKIMEDTTSKIIRYGREI